MNAAVGFGVALRNSEMSALDIVEMFRSGYHSSEIAERVTAMSGRLVTEAQTDDWLVTVGGFDPCTATPDGRSMCERPARPGTNPPRCSADDRSNR